MNMKKHIRFGSNLAGTVLAVLIISGGLVPVDAKGTLVKKSKKIVVVQQANDTDTVSPVPVADDSPIDPNKKDSTEIKDTSKSSSDYKKAPAKKSFKLPIKKFR